MAELSWSVSAPWLALGLAGVARALAAIIPQKELRNESRYRTYLEEGSFREALAFLNTLEPRDWPPAKSFRPDPYEGEVWRWLPGLMEQVTGREKRWVQEKLLWVFEETFGHRMNWFSEEDLWKILKGVERMEGGKEWIRASGPLWKKPDHWDNSAAEGTNLVSYLEGYGVKIETKELEE